MIKPHRPLNAKEREISKYLVQQAIRDVATLVGLVDELVIYRLETPVIRKARRCLPVGAQKALDALPHHHATAVEFNQN